MNKYNPQKIESKWQKKWQEDRLYVAEADKNKEKYYILDMFPYPSGDGLHMGHTESYTASDIIYRYKKLQGYDVLHPQGFDSFGLPAENYAIKTGTHPRETTKVNSDNYLKQMKMLGLGHDLEHLVYTSSPSYYKWTQFLFGKFFENGLVEQKTDTINWCSSCNTGIANEQVENGKCERCKTEIEQREIPGWFFKITDFADSLIDDLDKVDWPRATKKNQRAWIGKSEGARIKFSIFNFQFSNNDQVFNDKNSKIDELEVFTTRPDTLFGTTYMVIAPEHELIRKISFCHSREGGNPDQNSKHKDYLCVENFDEINSYVKKAKNKTELERMENKEKTGVELKGIKAINPANGEAIPIFVADYVLSGYGTGAIMAVPAHDERDFEFAKKFNIEIKQVVAPLFVGEGENAVRKDKENTERNIIDVIIKHWKDDKYYCLDWSKSKNNWKSFIVGGIEKGETIEEAGLREAKEESGYKNMKVVRRIGGEVHSHFFAAHKNVNRYPVRRNCVYIELLDGECEKPDEEHVKNHNGMWVEKNKVMEFANLPEMKMYWNIFLNGEKVFTDKGVLVNSGKFNDLSSDEAKKKITEFVGGEMTSNYRLRDWSISRQRYWGCPIPIVYSPEGEAKFVGEENLPWNLPEDVDFVPTGIAPLAKSKELKERTEKIFGKGWTPEVDTMDTFVDSSWYFLRYPDTENEQEFCSKEKLKRWLPVDLYIGGAEHTYMHLLYARFFVKAMKKIGLIDFDEPFAKLRHQGMVLDKDGVKMSKSKGNVINPNDMIEKFGADATRMYMMFAGPLEDDVMFKEDGVKGVYRFLEKVWRVFNEKDLIDCGGGCESIDKAIPPLFHKTIKKVTEDIENLNFNTAISQMMIFVNECLRHSVLPKSAMANFLVLLSPFAPHIAEEIWEQLGNKKSIFLETWPKYKTEMIVEEVIKIVVQVNGKVRDTLAVSADISENDVKELALGSEKIKKWTDSRKIKKVIYVKGKLISVVV